MTKKLILITVAALGLLYSEASLAKVCRLGDLSCDTNGFYGVGEGECDSSYKTCANPRAGATFCYAGDEAKYKDNDCCSTLVANEGYQECSIDDALVGYGKSCKGAADNITYWQYCGCSYGFVEVDGTNDPDDKALLDGNGDPIVNLDGNLVPYEARCAWDSKLYGGKCRFSQCNTDRRFFFENTGEYCKYRQETRCGGFGCMQVYDCNHDELNTGKEYYRNDSAQLAGGWDNFIPYLSEDQMTNEKDASGTVQLIKALNTTGNGLVTEDYNLTNKIVCSYAQSDGSGNDTGNGLNCNDVPNYCYLWTGCNNVRKWYSNHVNEGVIYDSEEAYLKWMEIVENQKGYNYSAQYVKNNPYHDAFYADVNPGYGTYTKNGNTYDAVNNSSCIKGIGCRITSANNGCTYITTNCHQDDAQHQCWKKISCSEENRFYSSFINASNVDNKTGKQELYLSSLNAPYWDEFYTGLQDKEIYPACLYEINECNDASGCYKKIGCETNFEDIRDHEEIENDWYPWFGDIRALCNDATRCYRATSCEPSVGAYSSRPNTSFFVTISSTATGLTCFRGQECYLATGSYTSVPNTSFFVTINSYASGSTCYRGQNCYIAGGAYSSSPNTSFFITISSSATGSTAYRGEESHIAAGAYSSKPNTSFFITISSLASGSTSYRGESTNPAAGAYTSTPNTSFFYVISSSASGSTAYRGQESHIAAGAYSSHPNTSFFITISSLASGSTSYRGESTNPAAGAYTSTPNTSFFYVINSLASGSTAYRGQESHIAAGAYSSHPNTSFFITISSLASGSTSYRGESSHIAAGAYTSTPNTSYFIVIQSSASGSISYRGESANPNGSYTSRPNTSFFLYGGSLASGSTAYRGSGIHTAAGAYSSTPNTSFFYVIYSLASGSTSYRGESSHIAAGAYSSMPNTSFFNVIYSLASGSTSYRSDKVHIAAGAYSSHPNTSFFHYIQSLASGSTSYRADRVADAAVGAYTSTPNSTYFVVHTSYASGSTCYRGAKCASTSAAVTNTSFFVTTQSSASGSTCYRAQGGCRTNAGAYTSAPNSSFFNVLTSTNAQQDSTCYRGGSCATTRGSYSSHPNTSFFNTSHSIASGSTCYRGESCRVNAGAYVSSPNSQFFDVITSYATGITCYRNQNCALGRGAYSSYPNTSFFNTSHSIGSGSRCYRGESCRTNAGAYVSSPNTTFFDTVSSSATGKTCYRGVSCGSGRSTPNIGNINTTYFLTAVSKASGSTCYRATACNTSKYWYPDSDRRNTYFTYTSQSTDYNGGSGNLTCYQPNGCQYYETTGCNTSGSTTHDPKTCPTSNVCASGYSTTRPNGWFADDSETCTDGKTCWYATGCASNYCSNEPSTSYFNTDGDCTSITGSGSNICCYKATGCKRGDATTSGCTSGYFDLSGKTTTTSCGGSRTCLTGRPAAATCHVRAEDQNKSDYKYYQWSNAKTCGANGYDLTLYEITGCKGNGSYNNSYVSNSITYNYRVGSTSKAKNYRYGEAFKEKTTRSEGISCNSYANCYIGCSCASGWTQGTAPSSGEYVWATDNRYTGVNSLSVGSGLNASGTIDAQSASSSISASGLSADSGAGISAKSSGSGNYSVSTMGTSGGMTCYKKACPDGYYLDAPNSTYFEYTTSTGPVELTCYKATGCKDGYATTGIGSAVASYHGFSCYEVPFDCKGWAEANGKASGIVWSSYTTSSTYMGNMKGPATLANEFPECANYETPTVTFTERVSISNATVDSVNLKFTSSDRMETCSFEKHHCCDGRPSGCTSGMPDCSDTDMASQRGCCPVGGNCYWGNNAVVSGTLVLRNTNISTNNTSYGVSTAYSQYSGGTIELQGNVTVNGVLSTEGSDGINGYSIHKGHLKVTSGNNFVKKFRVYGGYNSGATGTISAGAGLKTDDLYAYNLFSNGQGWNIQCSMFVYGALKLTGEYSPTNGCTVIYNGGYFEASSLKSYSSSVGTYEGKIVWNSGAQVQINGTCRKATSGGDVTVRGNDRITTNPVSGGSCSKADFITKL